MSNLSDDEGLFDDIYGDDDKTQIEQQKETEENKVSLKQEDGTSQETLTAATGSDPNLALNLALAPPPPPPPLNNVSQLDPSLLQQLQQQLQQQVQQQVQQVQHQRASLSRDAGKMFIGGLNWETSEDSLRLYFEKYGEIVDLTIMKDSNSGKSRGFGFLTFADPSSVDAVVKTSHVLDGKLIDPKRAIPKEEQDKTGKIFVGGIAPDVNEQDFNDYFGQFGNIIDAQLMIDKDSGRSRGFGFVTYDTPEAVDRVTENKYVMLKGRNMEIKRAEPRGQQNSGSNSKYFQQQQYQAGQLENPSAILNQFGVNNDMAQQYWQQMQQYFFQQMQQQYAANGMTMDPAMMQQYQYLQQQQQQQQQYPPQQQQQQDYNYDPQQQQQQQQQQYDDQDQVVNIQQQLLDNIPKQPKLTLPPRDVPANVPKGPRAGVPPSRGGGYRGGRGGSRGGRGRGGYRPRGGYHPYGR